MNLNLTRRQLLKLSAAGTATILSSGHLLAAETSKINQSKIVTFTKPFQYMSYAELAKFIADLGFDGIEAPIRQGGHIEPKEVEDELPKMVEALQAKDLTIEILTSSINSVDSPEAEKTLLLAAQLGIKYYRMAYYKYDLKKSINAQLANIKAQVKDLAAMNREIGITAVYQNHSGTNTFGAPLWDLYDVLKDLPAEEIAAAFDIGHATVEGGKSWPIQMNLLQDFFKVAYIKDFRWNGNRVAWVPLGTGNISAQFFETLKTWKFQGPITLHVEYLGKRDRSVQPQYQDALKKDLKTLKKLLAYS